jgi:hypothetical protein
MSSPATAEDSGADYGGTAATYSEQLFNLEVQKTYLAGRQDKYEFAAIAEVSFPLKPLLYCISLDFRPIVTV